MKSLRWVEKAFTCALMPLLLMLLASPLIAAREGFHDLTFAEAKKKAGAGKKLVMVEFVETGNGSCTKLDDTTWNDKDVIALLKTSFIAVSLDVSGTEGRALAELVSVKIIPTIMFFKADGAKIDYLEDYLEPAEFLREAKQTAIGKNRLTRLKEKLDAAPDKVYTHYNYAKALAEAGRNEDAAREMLKIFDKFRAGDDENLSFRREWLIPELIALSDKPDVRDEIKKRRDNAETSVLSGTPGPTDAADFAAVNAALGEQARTLATWDKLAEKGEEGANLRQALFDDVYLQLLDAKRYGDIEARLPGLLAAAKEGLEEFKELYKEGGKGNPDMRQPDLDGMTTIAAEYVEILCGLKRNSEALALAETFIEHRPGGGACAAMVTGAARGGAKDAARQIADKALAVLPDAEKAAVIAAKEAAGKG